MSNLHDRMFIAQSTLEAWMDSGRVQVVDNRVVLEKLDRTYLIEAAVRFVSVVPEGAAPTLLGKVLSEKRIIEIGGELLGDSVLFGDAAFHVVPGYIGTLVDRGVDGSAPPRRQPNP